MAATRSGTGHGALQEGWSSFAHRQICDELELDEREDDGAAAHFLGGQLELVVRLLVLHVVKGQVVVVDEELDRLRCRLACVVKGVKWGAKWASAGEIGWRNPQSNPGGRGRSLRGTTDGAFDMLECRRPRC